LHGVSLNTVLGRGEFELKKLRKQGNKEAGKQGDSEAGTHAGIHIPGIDSVVKELSGSRSESGPPTETPAKCAYIFHCMTTLAE